MALQPSSALGVRIVRRVSTFVLGQPLNVAADLGLDQPIPIEQTTLGDEEALRQFAKVASLARSVRGGGDEDTSRKARYQHYDEMVEKIPELRRCLDILLDFAFGGELRTTSEESRPFEVVYGENIDPRTKEAAERIIRRVSIYTTVPAIVREGKTRGDSFTELVYNRVSLLWQRPLSPWEVEPVWDDFGQLQGYTVTIGGGTRGSGLTGRGSKALSPFQLVHYAPQRGRNSKFGTSMFDSLRDTSRQFTNGVDLLFILLLLQAAHRRTIVAEVPREWDDKKIEGWVKKLKLWNADASFYDGQGSLQAKIATMLETEDKVFPYRKGSTKPEFDHTSAMDFGSILAILEWLQDRFFVGTGTPKALAGLAKDANSRATLEVQGSHFAKSIRATQKEAALIALEIIIRGILVEELPIKDGDIAIRMPSVSEFNDKIMAEVQKLRAEAAKILSVDVGIDDRWVLQEVLKVPAFDVEDVLAAMQQKKADEPAGDGSGDAPPEGAAADLVAELGETVERLREEVELLRPVRAGIRELLERAA